MKILKIIVDEIPPHCIFCSQFGRTTCGKMIKTQVGPWEETTWVPDERCILEVGK